MNIVQTIYTIFGIAGLLIISYSVWMKNERKQDVWFVLGGIFLLVYSISIGSIIFIVLQIIFISSALLELRRIRG